MTTSSPATAAYEARLGLEHLLELTAIEWTGDKFPNLVSLLYRAAAELRKDREQDQVTDKINAELDQQLAAAKEEIARLTAMDEAERAQQPSADTAAQKAFRAHPKPGQVWRHYNGNLYEVLMITNLPDTEKYPRTIVYRTVLNGNIWSRRYTDWHRSFTREPSAPVVDEAMIERARVAFCENILSEDCESHEVAARLIVGDVRDAMRLGLYAAKWNHWLPEEG